MCYMSTFSRQLPDTSGIILLRQLAVKYCGSLQKEEKEEEEEEEEGGGERKRNDNWWSDHESKVKYSLHVV